MENLYRIRQLTAEDIPTLQPLAQGFWDELPAQDYPPKAEGAELNFPALAEYWVQILEAGIGAIWVLEYRGHPVGFLQALRYHDRPTGLQIAAEEYWYVQPEHRGEGICLLARFEQWAQGIKAAFTTKAWSVPTFREQLDKYYRATGHTQIAGIYMRKV